jgi:integrase
MDITRITARRNLKPRPEPYWRPESGAYLGYRCLSATDGTWIGRVREDGKQHYHALGRHEEYRHAAAALKVWLDQRRAGVTDHRSTVADAVTAYVKALRTARGDTPANDALGRLERRVTGRVKASRKKPLPADPIARVRLTELRWQHVREWRERLPQETRERKASSQRDLNVFKAVLNFAHVNEMVADTSAWDRLEGFSDTAAGHQSRPYLTIEQRRALLAACTDVGLHDLVEGVALLGARPIELQRATVADFDARRGTLKLWSMKGAKAVKRTREIDLAALPKGLPLIKRLAKSKLPAAHLFVRSDGSAWPHSGHDELFRDAAAAAGLDPSVTLYALRHSFITDALAAGASLLDVARITGTSLPMIEKTYAKTVTSHTRAAFANMVAL